MLKNILSFFRSKPVGRLGYSYVADNDDSVMGLVQKGQIVRTEVRGSPWIVVDEAPTTAILARWPGRLWKVCVIEAAPDEDQPLAYARYTRALAVKVIGEESPARLFGKQGDEVLNVLTRAAQLNRGVALELSSARHPEAPAAFDRVFRLWADNEGIEIGYDDCLDGTLRVGSMPHGSPIYEGLSVLHKIIFDRAKKLDGDAATTIEDEDEYLNQPWQNADRVFADAALALGAPKFVSANDRDILLAAWARLKDGRL